MKTSKRRALVGAVVAIAMPVTAAFAAAPTKDANYDQTKGDKVVVSFHVSTDGKKIDVFSGYSKCNPVPFNPPIKMKINKSGTFNLSGTHKDVIGKALKVQIHGKFTSGTKASGTYKIDAKGCKGPTVKFKATLTGTGDSSPV
jgi:hypothetical protein